MQDVLRGMAQYFIITNLMSGVEMTFFPTTRSIMGQPERLNGNFPKSPLANFS